MKTIKIITLSILFTLTNLSFAQDSTNTATWEETIEFIRKNKDLFEKFEYFRDFSFSRNLEISNIEITQDKILLTSSDWYSESHGNSTTKYWIGSVEINLESLSLGTVENGQCNLWFTKDAVTYKERYEKTYYGMATEYPKKKIKSVSIDMIEFQLANDSEMLKRLNKAFKHLAYLATEKRKAEREASGDKF